MSTAEMMERIADGLPHHRAKVVSAYYLLTILTGIFVLFFHGRLAFAADLIAGFFYFAMTVLFYDLSKPVNRRNGGRRSRGSSDGRERPMMEVAGWGSGERRS